MSSARHPGFRMSTLEYGRYTGPPLEGDRLHRCLIDLQDSTVRKHHLKRPSLSVSEYEDLYARAMLLLLEKHPDASFPAPQAVVSWLDTTIARSAIDILRRRNLGRETQDIVSVSDTRGGEDEPSVVQPVDAAPTPEQYVLLNEESLTLKEFIASLDPDDRKISLLHLHPGSQMKLKQIAQALDLPTSQVNTVLKRVDKRFSRYIALEVDAVCALRERDLNTWKRTGEMPAALTWHARRCSACSAKIDAARTEVYRSLLPLTAAVGLPAGGGIGIFSRLYHSVGSHPAVIRTNEQLSPGRKVGAIGPGGGALISGKAIVATVVGAVAATGAGVAVVHSITSPPAHRTPAIHPTTARNTAPAKTGNGGAVIAGPPVRTKAKTTTTPKTTTTARTKTTGAKTTTARTTATKTTTSTATSSTTISQRSVTSAVISTPVVPQATVTTPRPGTKAPSTPKPAAKLKPAASPKPASSIHKTSTNAATAKKRSPVHSSSTTPGGLPDLQQTEQQP
jgi:RNA polymerase sigma factor (sigma-70 family)